MERKYSRKVQVPQICALVQCQNVLSYIPPLPFSICIKRLQSYRSPHKQGNTFTTVLVLLDAPAQCFLCLLLPNLTPFYLLAPFIY